MNQKKWVEFIYLPISLWISLFILFLVVHVTNDKILQLNIRIGSIFGLLDPLGIKEWSSYEPLYSSVKGFLFILCIGRILAPLIKDLSGGSVEIDAKQIVIAVGFSMMTMVIVSVLICPSMIRSMGMRYGLASLDPFSQPTNFYNKRLFMPVLAHVLFFKGKIPFMVFSYVVLGALLTLLWIWWRSHTSWHFWQFLSLCTSSFVVMQYQGYAGYPDILVFVFIMLLILVDWSQESRFSLLILCILTHESSALLATVLAIFFLEKRFFLAYLAALGLYAFIWYVFYGLFYGLDPYVFLDSHNVDDKPGPVWLFHHPLREISGIAVSFKLLWIFILWASAIAWMKRMYRPLLLIVGCVSAAVFMTVVGVDTSRLCGYAFPALLFSLSLLEKNVLSQNSSKKMLVNLGFLFNLLIPSYYIGLNSEAFVKPGIYSDIYWFMGESLESLFSILSIVFG
jgi:hypothetical protein